MGTSTLGGAVNVAGVINKKPFGIGRTSVRASCETVQNGLVPAARRMRELIHRTAVMSASALSYPVEIAIATESEAPRGRVAVDAGGCSVEIAGCIEYHVGIVGVGTIGSAGKTVNHRLIPTAGRGTGQFKDFARAVRSSDKRRTK